jgi:hypothetical protein
MAALILAEQAASTMVALLFKAASARSAHPDF